MTLPSLRSRHVVEWILFAGATCDEIARSIQRPAGEVRTSITRAIRDVVPGATEEAATRVLRALEASEPPRDASEELEALLEIAVATPVHPRAAVWARIQRSLEAEPRPV